MRRRTRLMEKVTFLEQAGYALVAVGLIFLIILTSAPQLRSPRVAIYSYGLLVGGILLVLLNKAFEITQYRHWQKLTAHCLGCGWEGTGKDFYRYEACPDCDADQVVLQQPWTT